MNGFVKKIFDGKIDDLVHLQFEKFGRGEYKDRAMVLAKRVGNRVNINTTAEYGNEFVRTMGDKLGNGKTKVSGVVISTRDLTGKLKFDDKKQFMGVKKYIISDEMTGKEILELCDEFPRAFLGLSFKVGEDELKIKPKAPKSGKPSTKGGNKLKVDFCKLKTSDEKIIRAVLFDVDNFKNVEIKHTFLIKDIILPEGVEDPNKMREMAKRKGKIIFPIIS